MLRLMKTREAANYLQIHIETLREKARNGEIPAERLGKTGDWRFRKNDLDEWLQKSVKPDDSAGSLAQEAESVKGFEAVTDR